MKNNALAPFDILLLEDELADAYLVKMAFKEKQIPVNLHHVVDGQEGLDFLQQKEHYENAPRPDLILLDINMPRMNGYEFLIAVKKNEGLKNIPVVVLSTSELESDILKSYQLGAASYISKATDVNCFMSTLSLLEDYWLTLVKLPSGKKV